MLRSPIQIRNTLKVPVEVKFNTNTYESFGQESMKKKRVALDEFNKPKQMKLYLDPDSTVIVPILKIDLERLKLSVRLLKI